MAKLKSALAVCPCLLVLGVSFLQADTDIKADRDERFGELLKAEWKQVFHDRCTGKWSDSWTLDGQKATVTNDANGMDFAAGPKAFDNAHHAVLWTKQDFKGDLKIEYEYTRLDHEIRRVTILYIQATGSGMPGFAKDISAWSDKRTVPAMSTYYKNMNTYHVSYAAFGGMNDIPGNDYIRGRRYMCGALTGTELDNEYEKTGLFDSGVPHKITIIKRDRHIFMRIRNSKKDMLCHFVNSKFPPIREGKIGLRHMYTRRARYKDFKVSVLATDESKSELSNEEQKATR